MTRLKLVGAVDPDPGATSVVPPGCALVDTVTELIDRTHPDLVIVATPPAAHRQVAAELMAARIPVVCEKPLAHNGVDARALEGLASERTTLNAVNFQLRYDPIMRRVRQLLHEGAIGTLLTVDIDLPVPEPLDGPWSWAHDRAQGGGVTMEYGSHYLDLLQWLLGPLELVSSHVSALSEYRTDRAGSRRPVTAEDRSIVVLRAPNGVLATLRIFATWERPSMRAVTFLGSEGSLVARLDGLTRYGRDGGVASMTPRGYEQAHWVAAPIRSLLADVVAHVVGGDVGPGPEWASFHDAAEVQSIVDDVVARPLARPTQGGTQ